MDEWGNWQARGRSNSSDRPGTVLAAAIFMFLGASIALLFTFGASGSPLFLIWGLAYSGAAVGVLRRIYWAWIAALVLAGLSTLSAITAFRFDSNVAVFILLLTPSARSYFLPSPAGDGVA